MKGKEYLRKEGEPLIHSTAVIHPGAVLGEGVKVGPFCVIGENVRIRRGTKIGSHVVIEGLTEIGESNYIAQFASLGAPPQDLKYRGEPTHLRIGDRNIIREYVTMHRGTVTGRSITEVGDDNLFMVGVHLPHDCKIGNKVIIANATHLGGHVTVEDGAVIGALVGIHQFARVGAVAMVAAKAGVPKDVPPYTIAAGDRATLFGLNKVGLERVGISPKSKASLKKAYRIIFQSSLQLNEAIKKVREEVEPCKEVVHLLEFIETSERGILR